MKTKLTVVLMLTLLMLFGTANAATKKPKAVDDDNVPLGREYDQQEPQQLDCQQIEVDERYIGGKVFRKKICFYDVEFGRTKRHAMMWHEVGSNNYGFGAWIGSRPKTTQPEPQTQPEPLPSKQDYIHPK